MALLILFVTMERFVSPRFPALHPEPVYLLAIAYASYLGGIVGGLICTGTVLAGGFLLLNEGTLHLWTVAAPGVAMSLLVSALSRAAGRRLEDLQSFASQIMEGMGEGLVVWDEQGRIIYNNPRYAAMVEASAASLQNRPVADFVLPERRDQQWQSAPAQDRAQGQSWEDLLLTAKQRVLPVRVTSHPLFQRHRFAGTAAVLWDLSAAKAAETALRGSEAQARRVAHFQAALVRAAERLNADLQEQAVLQAVVEEARGTLGLDAIHLRLWNPAAHAVVTAYATGLPEWFRERTPAVPPEAFEGLFSGAGGVLTVSDAASRPDLPSAPLYSDIGVKSLLATVMRREGEIVGSLTVYALHDPRTFDAHEVEYLRGLSHLAAQAIVNARLLARGKRQVALMSFASRAAGRLLSLSGETQRAAAACQLLVEEAGVHFAGIGRAEAGGRVAPLAYAGHLGGRPEDLDIRWQGSPDVKGPVAKAIESGQPVVINDLAVREEAWAQVAREWGYQSLAVLPLSMSSGVFGALLLGGSRAGCFDQEWLDIVQTFANLTAQALENSRLWAEIERRLAQTQALRRIDQTIAASFDLRVTLTVLLDEATRLLEVDAAAVQLADRQGEGLQCVASRGFPGGAAHWPAATAGGPLAARALDERRTLFLADAEEQPGTPGIVGEEQFRFCLATPLMVKGRTAGVLELFRRAPLHPEPEWLEVVETLASQAAVTVDNAHLFEELQRSHRELVRAYDATLEGWSRAVDLRDHETEGHSQRVTEGAVRLARSMGLSDEELIHIRRGALLHDIGKLGIPDQILLKPGPLTEAEWEVMGRHPVYAYEMLAPIPFLRSALDIPYCHHEKWDGSGYPRGLKGAAIPLAARIFAVIDVWDALRSDRPYRSAWPEERVREYIASQAGQHFDPAVVEAFLALEW